MDIILVCLMSACVFHIIYHIILLYYSFRLSRQTQGTILHVIPLDKLSKYGISFLENIVKAMYPLRRKGYMA